MTTESKQLARSSLPQKQILVVDDDPALLFDLEIQLSAYPGLQIITAENGVQAVDRLANQPVDLVVTDIQMPEMDGLSLVSHISKHHPKLPVIVVTAHASETNEHKLTRLGIVSYIKKPFDYDYLAEKIFDLLVGVDSGYVHGISVASFLQLLHSDHKTCCLRITAKDRVGFLHFVNGEIWDAQVGDLVGLPAAFNIIAWEEELTIDIQNIVRLKERTVDMDVTFLIMESVRRKDEADSGITEKKPPPRDSFLLPERGSFLPDANFLKPHECLNAGKSVNYVLSDRQQFMLFECLTRLRDVAGYKASAVLTHKGEAIITHSSNAKDDIALVAKAFNDMFVVFDQRTREIGMKDWEETVFRSADGVVVFRCSANPSSPHIHLVVITDDLPGEGMIRTRMKRVFDELASLIGNMRPSEV
jgi:CheY-like chemotaxis protein